jgi:hypothetical protein
MKTDKPIDEAILRAQGSAEQENQSQDKLYAMRVPQNTNQTQNTHGEAPLNESHTNLMQSWQNLRGLDSKLAQTKYKDLAEGPKSAKVRRNV